MIILVASVHHTGTKLVFNDILRNFPEVNQQNYLYSGRGKIRIHVDEPFLDDLDYWGSKALTIVPLRHPEKVAIGWKVRGKRLEELSLQWHWLKERISKFDPYYLPIDSPLRSNYLDEISWAMQIQLETEWPIIGSCEQTIELNEKDKEHVRSWMQDGFFEEFGYE